MSQAQLSVRHGLLLDGIEGSFAHHWEIGEALIPWPPTGRRGQR
jgi:hypothetical protein